ncbi:MAG: RNA-binding domain-containing protein [Deltaproteobacteria bacterium]|mgnify:CR=1 FL=1
MIAKPFDDIEQTDIKDLVKNKVSEGRAIEYKQVLPGHSDSEKREFLADVSAFANAGGGDLLYGVSANDGVPQEAVGLDDNMDSEMLRLENMVRDSLEPRIPDIRMKPIQGFKKGPVLLVRIPMSRDAPHAIKSKGRFSFYVRNSAGKHQMSMSELRAVFLDSEASLMGKFDDVKNLDNASAYNIIVSSLRKLADRGITNFDFRGSRFTNFSFFEQGIRSLSGSIFADGLWFNEKRNNFGYMRHIDFSSVDCREVLFSKGNLSLATYENCNFWSTDLRQAIFTGATLKWDAESVSANESQWSIIEEMDDGEPYSTPIYTPAFDGADLDKTSFEKCTFINADFRGAKNILNASFIEAKGLDTCFFDEGIREKLK